jgi:4-hydroxybenzoate polyprenyltransferase
MLRRTGRWPLLDACFFLCFTSSAIYILNSCSTSVDRHHRQAIGRSRRSALAPRQTAVLPLLLVAAFALALWQLPLAFAGVLATYYGLTLAYSLSLKRRGHRRHHARRALALQYCRFVALGLTLSFWLLAFSMFIF